MRNPKDFSQKDYESSERVLRVLRVLRVTHGGTAAKLKQATYACALIATDAFHHQTSSHGKMGYQLFVLIRSAALAAPLLAQLPGSTLKTMITRKQIPN